jgi:plastocyanin
MRLPYLVHDRTVLFATLAGLLPFSGGAALAAATSPEFVVSQIGRTFRPAELTIKRGDTIQILNDDGDLLHHVYLDSEKFTFDSGDQKPGSRTSIQFPVVGDFTVLCAIHPKMKLIVRVK